MCKYTFSGTFLVYFNWAKKVNANKAEIGKHVQLSENKSYVCEREKTRKIEKRKGDPGRRTVRRPGGELTLITLKVSPSKLISIIIRVLFL